VKDASKKAKFVENPLKNELIPDVNFKYPPLLIVIALSLFPGLIVSTSPTGFEIIKEPVTPNEPVISADPVYGNGSTYPSRYDAVKAYEDVPNREPVIPSVTVSEPENIAGPMFVK
jgi:hypothetical protein